MDEFTSHDLNQRLERLELEARWLRWSVIVLLVVGIVAPVLVARAASDKVSASQFVLVDGARKERGAFWLFGDMPTLTIPDKAGRPRFQLDLLPDESPRIFLADTNQRIRAKLMLTADGSPLLEMLDKEGRVIWKAP